MKDNLFPKILTRGSNSDTTERKAQLCQPLNQRLRQGDQDFLENLSNLQKTLNETTIMFNGQKTTANKFNQHAAHLRKPSPCIKSRQSTLHISALVSYFCQKDREVTVSSLRDFFTEYTPDYRTKMIEAILPDKLSAINLRHIESSHTFSKDSLHIENFDSFPYAAYASMAESYCSKSQLSRRKHIADTTIDKTQSCKPSSADVTQLHYTTLTEHAQSFNNRSSYEPYKQVA